MIISIKCGFNGNIYFILQWHAGFYAEPFFPTKRGFDSHFGFLSGEGDYFSHFDLMPGMIKYKVKYVLILSTHPSLLDP